MECPFAEVGCQATNLLTPRDYQQHLSRDSERHLKLVMDLHQRSLGHEVSGGGGGVAVTSLQSPLDKLNRVNSEVAYLEGVLGSYGMSNIPALECIKTQLRLPDVCLKNLGDAVTFRMPNFSRHRERDARWLSAPFHVEGGHKMCVCVHPGGTRSGKGSHVSVSLLLLFDDQLEWPIALPHYLGVRVELVDEPDGRYGGEDREVSNNDPEAEVVWHPKDGPKELGSSVRRRNEKKEKKKEEEAAASPPNKRKASKDLVKFRARSLPPWCAPPPDLLENPAHTTTTTATTKSSVKAKPASEEAEQEQEEGVTLVLAEKFAVMSVAEHFARGYDSLIFRVALCLV